MKKGGDYSSDKSSGSYGAIVSPKDSPKPVPGAHIRILNELMEIRNKNMLNVEAEASKDSIFKWDITFPAPNGKAVKAELHFDSQFPFTPPRMFMKQKLFHPNISDEGEVCLQCLKENWAASNSIWSLIVSVQALLSDPSPQDPVNAHAANLLLEKPEEYHELASQCFNELDSFAKDKKNLPNNASPKHASQHSSEHSLDYSSFAQKRILIDLMKIKKEKLLNVEVCKDSIFKWDITFPAPNGKPVKAELRFDSQYPFTPPRMFMKQKLFHRNISDNGEVQGLKENWRPTSTILNVILSVYDLLYGPNPQDPVNTHAANSFKDQEIASSGPQKRILNELMEIRNENMLNVEAEASEDSIFKWDVTFPAPNGRAVKAELHFDSQYPFSPPKMIIKSKLFHPNISDKGEVCLQCMKENWLPTMSSGALILSVQALLAEPNPNDAVNCYAARFLLKTPKVYHDIASEYFDKLDSFERDRSYLPDNASPEHSPKYSSGPYQGIASPEPLQPVPGGQRRILTDMREIQNDNTLYIEVKASEDSIFEWNVTFPAPNGETVKAVLHFDSQYPYSAPKMVIKSKLFHPNISDNGEVCLQGLKEDWNPTMSTWALILSVQALLAEPNPHDPANANAANLLLKDPEAYHRLASLYFEALAFSIFPNDDSSLDILAQICI